MGRKRRYGFTLPELMAVFCILALHGALLAPTLRGAREEAHRVLCARNLGRVGSALRELELEREAMPASSTSSASFLQLMEEGYLPGAEILSCPSNSVDVDLQGGPEALSYYIDPRTPLLRHPMRAIAADRNLHGDWRDNHGPDGVNVLMGGETVQFLSPDNGKIGNPFIGADADIYSGPYADPDDACIAYMMSMDVHLKEGIYVFLSDFTGYVPEGLERAAVIVVGGGGGGGRGSSGNPGGGGGGGGGVVVEHGVELTAGDTVTVAVGTGGKGGEGRRPFRSAQSGNSSELTVGKSTISAPGGGAGGCHAGGYSEPEPGASGGGAGGNEGLSGAVGEMGGDGGDGAPNLAGGGGGAGARGLHGGEAGTRQAGHGGEGVSVSEMFPQVSALEKLGEDGWFGGGGGGGAGAGGRSSGEGGKGGGGAGRSGGGRPGMAGSGGGGGSARGYSSGGDGGSGIVIVIPETAIEQESGE